MKKTYKVHGLIIEAENGGALTGTLKDTCPYCKQVNCTCQFNTSAYSYNEAKHTECINRELYNDIMDGLESFILALAAEGIDVSQPAFVLAIQTAQDAVMNKD